MDTLNGVLKHLEVHDTNPEADKIIELIKVFKRFIPIHTDTQYIYIYVFLYL